MRMILSSLSVCATSRVWFSRTDGLPSVHPSIQSMGKRRTDGARKGAGGCCCSPMGVDSMGSVKRGNFAKGACGDRRDELPLFRNAVALPRAFRPAYTRTRTCLLFTLLSSVILGGNLLKRDLDTGLMSLRPVESEQQPEQE